MTSITSIDHGEEKFEGANGIRLFNQYWKSENAKAVLIIVHGLKDHSSRYATVAEQLASHGYAVYGFDLRGHGKSDGERAFVKSFDEYLKDLELFYELVRQREPGRPTFLYGHSMGGAIALLFVLTKNPEIKGLILTGPALKIGNDISPLLVWFTKRLAGIAPKRPVLKLDNKLFSHDPEMVAGMDSDPLVYNKPHPARTAGELLRAIERIQKNMSSLTTPVLIMHGSADKITNPEGSRELQENSRSTDKTLKQYEGFYHDLLHEIGREQVASDLTRWLDIRVSTATSGKS